MPFGLGHFINWERETLSVDQSDRVAQLTGLSFDVVLRDIFLPLSSGACLCLPDSGFELEGGKAVSSWLAREHITVFHTVPSLVQSWLNELQSPQLLPDLRWILFAGEPLTDKLVTRWQQHFGTTAQIVNLYGPTETTLAKSFLIVGKQPLPRVQPIGRPLPDTQILILNKSDQLCGMGEPGEICIRTSFRTLGYLNALEQEKGRFIQNPFCADKEDLIYRTGDLGAYKTDGEVLIRGRLDDQVKIRGIRIEPGEIGQRFRTLHGRSAKFCGCL